MSYFIFKFISFFYHLIKSFSKWQYAVPFYKWNIIYFTISYMWIMFESFVWERLNIMFIYMILFFRVLHENKKAFK